MKKVLAGLMAVGCFAAAGSALAGIGAGTGVNGSLHDMNVIANSKTDSMGRVCAFCHTPHHAQVKSDNGQQLPLWNHRITASDNFVPYTWATPNNASTDEGDFSIVDPVMGPSRLCMSCHDGSFSVDEHGSAFAQTGLVNIANVAAGEYAGRANLTKNLSDTHPIGFDYVKIATYRNNKTVMGNGLGNADGTEIVWPNLGYAKDVQYNDNQEDGYNTVTRANEGKIISDNLFKGSFMTCATCHEVHNKENMTQEPYTDGPRNVTIKTGPVSQAAPNYFLYSKQDKSLICLSCHIK